MYTIYLSHWYFIISDTSETVQLVIDPLLDDIIPEHTVISLQCISDSSPPSNLTILSLSTSSDTPVILASNNASEISVSLTLFKEHNGVEIYCTAVRSLPEHTEIVSNRVRLNVACKYGDIIFYHLPHITAHGIVIILHDMYSIQQRFNGLSKEGNSESLPL